MIALKAGRVAFDGKPAEIDERRFKEIYGEDAVEVEIGVTRTAEEERSEATRRLMDVEALSDAATDAAMAERLGPGADR